MSQKRREGRYSSLRNWRNWESLQNWRNSGRLGQCLIVMRFAAFGAFALGVLALTITRQRYIDGQFTEHDHRVGLTVSAVFVGSGVVLLLTNMAINVWSSLSQPPE